MNEKQRKWIILGIILIVIIFAVSYIIGLFLSRDEEPVQMPIIYEQPSVETPSPTAEPTAEPVSYYIIKTENSKLVMYFVSGEQETQIKSEEVSEEVFPSDDILMLSEGITAETAEEAIAVWENFVS